MKLIVALGLAVAPPVPPRSSRTPVRPRRKAQEQRKRAIARCKENRGADCESDVGLAEWLLQERSRDEAEPTARAASTRLPRGPRRVPVTSHETLVLRAATRCGLRPCAGALPIEADSGRAPAAGGERFDIAVRIVAERMAELLGQGVVVENVSGVGGLIGTNRVAAARRRYTLAALNNSILTILPHMQKGQTKFDSFADFVPLRGMPTFRPTSACPRTRPSRTCRM